MRVYRIRPACFSRLFVSFAGAGAVMWSNNFGFFCGMVLRFAVGVYD